jgi:hypothetical protein
MSVIKFKSKETQCQFSTSKAKKPKVARGSNNPTTKGWRKPSQPSFVQCPTFKVHLLQHMKSDSNRCKNWQLSLDQNTFFLKPKIWMIIFVLVLAIGFIYSIFSFWSVIKESWCIQKGLRGKENCCLLSSFSGIQKGTSVSLSL